MIEESIILIGYLAKDGVYKEGEYGGFVSFNVGAKADKNGDTQWFKCTKNKSQGLSKYLLKGTKVLITGRPYDSTYRDPDGLSHVIRCISCNNITLLDVPKDATIAQGKAIDERKDLPY